MHLLEIQPAMASPQADPPGSKSKSGPRRSRSRSPRADRDGKSSSHRRSEREKYRDRERDEKHGYHHHHHHHHHHRHHHRSSHRDRDGAKGKSDLQQPDGKAVKAVALPYNARQLLRADLQAFKPLFGHYLDLQKGLVMGELDDAEVRGRWKSFMGKWNRGELAQGWYEPETFERVRLEFGGEDGEVGESGEGEGGKGGAESDGKGSAGEGERVLERGGDGDEEEEEYGPLLPGAASSISRPRGPGVPTLQDLDLRRETNAEEREARLGELRGARKADRQAQKERLDEIAPRADAGTRERKMEKRKELNEKMRSFRDPSPGGDEVAEEELVGGGGGVADYKKMLATEKQKLSERQQRREEIAMARTAERDERIKAYREREEGTIEKLRELAKRRFG